MKLPDVLGKSVILSSAWRYNLRIFIALTGCAALPWWLNSVTWTIPLTLGVVAAALADLDDRLTGRLRNLIITLLCFCLASVSVELLFPWPIWFMFGLALSTWGFILLGALGQRYATIAFGALLIAVYTMLGIGLFDEWYMQPALLLTGAVWYNLLTLIGHMLFPVRPVQEQMAKSYMLLANSLEAKASLFDPDGDDTDDAALIDVAMANSQLVTQLNITKASIQSRLQGDRGQRSTRRTLHYYFVAQDIHERVSSSHAQYHLLRQQEQNSEVLFRFQRILSLQAKACRRLSQAIISRQRYQHDTHFERSFTHLDSALTRLEDRNLPGKDRKALRYLFTNLKAIDAQLATIESEQALEQAWQQGDTHLSSEGLTGWSDVRLRVGRHLSPQSALFRHAVRMTFVLCVGYAFIQLTGLHRGYWILLTSLFVCQPNYNATKRRLALRIVGTLAGVAIGLPVLWLVPSIEGQLILIVITGVLFFSFRLIQYAHATMFITLLVLCCFNLLGEGFAVALPRVVDTLLGCFIAWLAVVVIWPDWRFRPLNAVASRALHAGCRYLDAINHQYQAGKDNSLDYRIARRDAHNADAELASVVSNLATEPKAIKQSRDAAFRLLCLNHSFLSYVSTLGAHREQLHHAELLTLLGDAVQAIDLMLQENSGDNERAHKMLADLNLRINSFEIGSESKAPLVLQQLGLIIALLPELAQLKRELNVV